MSRLPPAEKLPLALRKNIRDDWESAKGGLESELSGLLGTAWTVDISPNAIWPYAKEGSWPHGSIGSCIRDYVKGAIFQLGNFASKYGDEGKKELNSLCSTHVLTMDMDEAKKYSPGGVEIKGGKLVILFAADRLASNIDDALNRDTLHKAMNEAEPADGEASGLSYAARTGISKKYEPKIEAVRSRIAEIIALPELKLNPNFEAIYAKLAADKKQPGSRLRDDWDEMLGSIVFFYFSGVVGQLERQKFADDDMLQEGLKEVMDKGEIAVRVVDELAYDTTNECVIEDGVLYLQCKPSTWASNTDDAAQKLVDQL